ncbi:MAG: hypothetical protein KAW39_03090 [Thermoplasmata archaeon]|nr:hypothetical protein [Thermoplasmata archaeon]
MEEAKHLYLTWELAKLGCERMRRHVDESTFRSDDEKTHLRDLLIEVISEPLNNGVARALCQPGTSWRRESYLAEHLELANQVGDLSPPPHLTRLSRAIDILPDSVNSTTMLQIQELRKAMDVNQYDPILVVEPADRGTITGAQGTILDGNKRAIALCLEGVESIRAIIGQRH